MYKIHSSKNCRQYSILGVPQIFLMLAHTHTYNTLAKAGARVRSHKCINGRYYTLSHINCKSFANSDDLNALGQTMKHADQIEKTP